MPPERVAALEDLVKTSPYWDNKDPPELQLRHDLMRAKLSGFMDRPSTVARRYPLSDHSLPARYARAISTYRFGDLRQAVAQIDALIEAQPQQLRISTSSRARRCSRAAIRPKRSRRCAARSRWPRTRR